jgi:peptidoglycan/LPS O-acetylase OafA/YrhL
LRPYSRQAVPSYVDFFLRRALRVFPAFLVVIAAYFIVPDFREQAGISPLWRFLTFTMNFGLDARKYGAFSHAWSLCVEEHFYLILPVVIFFIMRKPSIRRTALLASVIVVLGLVTRALLWLHYIGPLVTRNASHGNQFLEYIYYPTYNRLDGPLVGVLIGAIRIFRPLAWQKITAHGNAILVSGMVVLAGAFWICQSMFSFATAVVGYPLLALGFGLLVVGGLSPTSVLATRRVFGATLVATLSYSTYLTHKEVMHFVNGYLSPWIAENGLGLFFIYVTAFFVAAAVLYACVERTGFRIRDHFLSKRLKEYPLVALAIDVD